MRMQMRTRAAQHFTIQKMTNPSINISLKEKSWRYPQMLDMLIDQNGVPIGISDHNAGRAHRVFVGLGNRVHAVGFELPLQRTKVGV